VFFEDGNERDDEASKRAYQDETAYSLALIPGECGGNQENGEQQRGLVDRTANRHRFAAMESSLAAESVLSQSRIAGSHRKVRCHIDFLPLSG
jgi:hypothetical protein